MNKNSNCIIKYEIVTKLSITYDTIALSFRFELINHKSFKTYNDQINIRNRLQVKQRY